MPIETRSSSALFKRAEQLKRWDNSETNLESSEPNDRQKKIQFSDGCIFLAACAAGDTEEVERLLSIGTDINTTNVDGLTALHQACIDNNLEMVQFLVEHDCDVNRGDNEGWTPLHATASCGFLSIAEYLIENGANVAAVNNDGDLPIDIAESLEMEDYLSEVLKNQGIDCDEARSEEERIMLQDAKQMLNSNNYQETIHPITGATSLHVAAAKGYIGVMKILIQLGADLNAQDNDGWTPLHAAAHWGQEEACAVLCDSLANMDIQNFAGQTCFDVADPEVVKLLDEKKTKQTTLQKDKPEIQAILQKTSDKPPSRRRTSVTRMSNQEKSKSVMKDTKAERAQIENLTLPEEDTEEDKEKKLLKDTREVLSNISPKKDISQKPTPDVQQKPSESGEEPQLDRTPSWKKYLRRASENLENPTLDISEVTLKRPRKADACEKPSLPEDTSGKDGDTPAPLSCSVESAISSNAATPLLSSDPSPSSPSQDKQKPFSPPSRDEESELQRKAHAKRVRETRRSTQGVLLEDIKSAELQFLINTQKEAAQRQASELDQLPSEESNADKSKEKPKDSAKSQKQADEDLENKSSVSIVKESSKNKGEDCGNKAGGDAPSVTLVLRPKASSSPDDTSPSETRGASLGTQAAIQRRRRPKRRSTGVVYLDSDDGQDEKESTKSKEKSQSESGQGEKSRHRYGSSVSVGDVPSDVCTIGSTPSLYGSSSSHSSLKDDEFKDNKKSEGSTTSSTAGIYASSSRSSLNEDANYYKELYEELRRENDSLKSALKKAEDELEKHQKQLQKLSLINSNKNNIGENDKKEKRALERKISELEEELKNISNLKSENEKLKAENRALSRVICKLTK